MWFTGSQQTIHDLHQEIIVAFEPVSAYIVEALLWTTRWGYSDSRKPEGQDLLVIFMPGPYRLL